MQCFRPNTRALAFAWLKLKGCNTKYVESCRPFGARSPSLSPRKQIVGFHQPKAVLPLTSFPQLPGYRMF